MYTLVKPALQYKTTYIKGISEIIDSGYLVGKLDPAELEANFETYLAGVENFELGIDIPEGFSQQTERWLINEVGEYAGTVKIKHVLGNEYLASVGGHIGYYIVPSFRSRGLGSLILKLGLATAKDIGLEKILITCNKLNIGSKKIIEKNGGVFESEAIHPNSDIMLRYWISLYETAHR